MRHLAALVAVAVAALGAVGTSSAQATHINRHIEERFFSFGLSQFCGVEIFLDIVGDVKVTLVHNQSGLVVREIQTSGNAKTTFSAPQTGKSFSIPFERVHIDYGAGAVVGSEFVMTITGLFDLRPGPIPSQAGLVRVEGVVTGFDALGAPTLQTLDVIVERGNRVENEQLLNATCAALT